MDQKRINGCEYHCRMEHSLYGVRAKHATIEENDITMLSPLGHEHINIVGRYSFILPEEIKNGQLRTLIYEPDEGNE